MDSPIFQSIVLGLLQGLTEFLPVSSSGHLALAQNLIPGFEQPGVLLDVMLHAGTLIAVVLYFRADLVGFARSALLMARTRDQGPEDSTHREDLRLMLGIFIAQFPTAAVGLLLQDRVEGLFQQPAAVGAALIGTAIILVAGELAARRTQAPTPAPSYFQSALIGIVQGLAVIPGISRSGATISAATAMGVNPQQAARFSFLVSVPAIAGATLITALKHRGEIMAFTGDQLAAYLIGPLVAAVVGYVAIATVMRLIQGRKLVWFAPYCALVGVAAVAYGLAT